MKKQREKENYIPRKIQLILLFVLGCTSMIWAFHFPTYAWFTTSVQTGMIELRTDIEVDVDIIAVEVKSANSLSLQFHTNAPAKDIRFEFERTQTAQKYIKAIRSGTIIEGDTKDVPSIVEIDFEFYETNSHQHPITMIKPSTGNYKDRDITITLPIKYYINDSQEPAGHAEIDDITFWVPQGFHER